VTFWRLEVDAQKRCHNLGVDMARVGVISSRTKSGAFYSSARTKGLSIWGRRFLSHTHTIKIELLKKEKKSPE
jgi:hypothetical protein